MITGLALVDFFYDFFFEAIFYFSRSSFIFLFGLTHGGGRPCFPLGAQKGAAAKRHRVKSKSKGKKAFAFRAGLTALVDFFLKREVSFVSFFSPLAP